MAILLQSKGDSAYFSSLCCEKLRNDGLLLDLAIVNFEIMHLALLAKLSIERECYTVAIPKSSIYKIYFNESKSSQTGDYSGIHINKLHILTKSTSTTGMVFEIITGMKGATSSFFKKSYFSSFLANLT